MFETVALRHIDETLDDDEWPLLELKDATVSHQHRREQSGKLVDLFDVHLHGPFRVKGRLGKLKKDQESLALAALTKIYSEEIIINKVYTYSLEIKHDGRIVIWVLGNAGWYALSPAKEYKAIFDQMVEKTKIWLFVEEKYTPLIFKGKGKKLKGNVHELYIEFSQAYPEWPTAKDVEALFHKHHDWLILKMLVNDDEVENWARTPLHTEMFSRYKDSVEEIQRIQKRRSALASSTHAGAEKLSPPPDSQIHVKSSVSESSNSQISPTPIMISNPISLPRNIRANSKSPVLFTSLEAWAIRSGLNPAVIDRNKLLDITFETYEFKDKSIAKDVLCARAHDLVALMVQSQRYPWNKTRALSELRSTKLRNKRYTVAINHKLVERFAAGVEVVDKQMETPAFTTPSPSVVKEKSPSLYYDNAVIMNSEEEGEEEDEEEEDEEEQEEEESEVEQEDVKSTRSSKGKSVLRPRASDIPVEVPSPLTGHSDGKVDEDEEMVDCDYEDDMIIPSKSRIKREAEEEGSTAERLTKRYRSLHAQARTSQSPSVESRKTWPELRPGTGKPPIKVGHLPPTSSDRPGGVWICSVPNCKLKIFEADTLVGRRQVEAHYESHGRVMQDALDLIGSETQATRGMYHVDNLLAKIEEMANNWAEHRP
ncbi:hypothetical protein BDZ91DRAFT_738975 [Kalaharituber pfeilii]|nr:hypothetical protein BDZ91DRAFT_738975 [Kalaharituber pfeilii]